MMSPQENKRRLLKSALRLRNRLIRSSTGADGPQYSSMYTECLRSAVENFVEDERLARRGRDAPSVVRPHKRIGGGGEESRPCAAVLRSVAGVCGRTLRSVARVRPY
jgi:hypothetical protein